MELSQTEKNVLATALFANGRQVFLVVDSILSSTLEDKYSQTNTKGNLFEDIPKMYKREGAINELKKLRSLLIDLESEAKRKAVKTADEDSDVIT